MVIERCHDEKVCILFIDVSIGHGLAVYVKRPFLQGDHQTGMGRFYFRFSDLFSWELLHFIIPKKAARFEVTYLSKGPARRAWIC